MNKNKTLKFLLLVQGFVLLIPVFTTVKINHTQSKIDNVLRYSDSKFLELRRAEISISDSRLEVIEALIYAEKLQLDEDQKIKFTDTLQNIKSRYKNKLDLYQPFLDEYSSIRSSAIADIDRYSKDKTAYESFGLLAIIIAFMMNAWIIYKYTKEN